MSNVREAAYAAKKAARTLACAAKEEKNTALALIADALVSNTARILEANALDVASAREKGMSESLIDRLFLSEGRIADMAQGVREVAELCDPIGEIIEHISRPNGLEIDKVRVPIGVIGMIYEARPNVTVDSAALALKSGNAILLRGSASALRSNSVLADIMREALLKSAIPEDAINLITDTSHEGAEEMMCMTDAIDLLIPRGGASLINNVIEKAKVPVIRTGVGNCHIYLDSSADHAMAKDLIINSKAQRPSTCNAAETLLISENYPDIPGILSALKDANIRIHGCEKVCQMCDAVPADEADYECEYLSLDICVKIVKGIDEAIDHIARYGTGHTELIITDSAENAERFMNETDAASVNHNASTRFTDGGQFGFGAEIGIATQKLHARGPLGLRELTIYKYKVYGNGQGRK